MGPIAMLLLLLAAGGTFAWTMRRRLAPLLHARADMRWDRVPERVVALLKFGLGQKRLVDPGERDSGLAHVFVFAAFMVLSLRTITLIGMGFSEGFHLPLLGPDTMLGAAYGTAQQTVLLLMLVGVAIFFWFRVIQPKERLTLSVEGWAILLTIASLSLTDILFESADTALHPGEMPVHLYVTTPLAIFWRNSGVSDGALALMSAVGFWVHVVTILAFGNFLPYGKHFHIITGLPTVFLQRLPPVGALSRLDLENSTQFGSAKVTDLTWKEMLDTYSCTECGRCQTHCPTYVTGKPLSHKEVNREIRHHLQEVGPQMPFSLAALLKKAPAQDAAAQGEGATATGPQLPEAKALAGEGGLLPDETIWACTTCGWCETACPVFIENVPRIVDMRRNKVLMEASFPAEAQRVFDNMEQQYNPWGVGSNKRAEWAEGLDVPVAASLAAAGNQFEYLFFVGCAGSFDDRQKKVSRALVKIMKEGKVDFAILGEEEQCTGDSARRLGNEYLFQTLAQSNIETFKRYGVTKVITQCPHCFNTIANEYKQFGVHFEAIHHTQLIDQLLKEGRIKLTKEVQETNVTFHDSCYLARYNGITEEPRNVLKSVPKLKILEMPRHGKQGFCCGAGGGRMWLEEKLGSRINQNRVAEAAETGAQTVATSCPFCLTMLRDGINETGREDKLVAKDIAEIVAASLQESAPAPASETASS